MKLEFAVEVVVALGTLAFVVVLAAVRAVVMAHLARVAVVINIGEKMAPTYKPPRPPKPVDRMQNMKTIRPLGRQSGLGRIGGMIIRIKKWEWVLGHWSK